MKLRFDRLGAINARYHEQAEKGLDLFRTSKPWSKSMEITPSGSGRESSSASAVRLFLNEVRCWLCGPNCVPTGRSHRRNEAKASRTA